MPGCVRQKMKESAPPLASSEASRYYIFYVIVCRCAGIELHSRLV